MADPAEIIARMREAFLEPKVVAGPLTWRDGNRAGKFSLACLAQGPTHNTELHITAVAALPNEDVSFQLCFSVPGQTFQMARFDWKPPRSHVNKVGQLKGLSCETGLHPFEENAELGLAAMATQNLPICIPLAEEPPDFQSAVAYVCATFSLQFADPLPLPPWSPTLI